MPDLKTDLALEDSGAEAGQEQPPGETTAVQQEKGADEAADSKSEAEVNA